MNREDNSFNRNNLKRTAKVLFLSSLLVFFLVGAALGYTRYYEKNQDKKIVQTELGTAEFDIPQSEEVVNALIIGLDKGGTLTDTIMIVNYDPKTSSVSLISIPRDTLIGIRGSTMKLNSAFACGKIDMTINSIRELTGLPIHYYAAIDTSGFRKVIDLLGGVEFDVPKDMYYYDPYQNLKIDLKKGPQLLDGSKAEQLVRYRQYPMGDLERTEVQKKFIKNLIEQKLNMASISDIPKMKQIFDTLKSNVKTNVTFNDGMKYIVSALKIKPEKIKTYMLPGQPKDIYGVSYYIYNKNKTLELFSNITGISKIELEKNIGKNSSIKTYDVGIIDVVFPPRQVEEENQQENEDEIIDNGTELEIEESPDTTENENKIKRNPFLSGRPIDLNNSSEQDDIDLLEE